LTVHRSGAFDLRAFADTVDRQRQQRGMSAREANREIGLPEAGGVVQLRAGVMPTAETLARYMHWLGITDLGPYLRDGGAP
jgi:hypothetical protein